jgi:hypothetical protein
MGSVLVMIREAEKSDDTLTMFVRFALEATRQLR